MLNSRCEEAGVQEAGGDDAPVVAVRDVGAAQRALLEQPAAAEAAAGGARPAGQLADERDHADADQDVGEHRLVGRRAASPRALRALARALGAAHAHRRRGHAVRADRPLAVRAAHAGLPVGVPVAGLHPGKASCGYRVTVRIGFSLGARDPPRGSRVTITACGAGQVLRHRHRAAAVRADLEGRLGLDHPVALHPGLVDRPAPERGHPAHLEDRAVVPSPWTLSRRWRRAARSARRWRPPCGRRRSSPPSCADAEPDQQPDARSTPATSAGRSEPPQQPAQALAQRRARRARAAPSRSLRLALDDLHQRALEARRRLHLLDRARQQVGGRPQALDLVPALGAVDQVPLERGALGIGQGAQQVGADLVPVCRVIPCVMRIPPPRNRRAGPSACRARAASVP